MAIKTEVELHLEEVWKRSHWVNLKTAERITKLILVSWVSVAILALVYLTILEYYKKSPDSSFEVALLMFIAFVLSAVFGLFLQEDACNFRGAVRKLQEHLRVSEEEFVGLSVEQLKAKICELVSMYNEKIADEKAGEKPYSLRLTVFLERDRNDLCTSAAILGFCCG